jgi:hypothetical protein
MARITWLGDVECLWNKVMFPAGVPVEINDSYMIGKARNSPFFRVEDAPAVQWRSETEADPADVSFFDDPPEVQSVFGPERDHVPEPDPPKRKRGRPPKVRHNVDQ